MERHSAEKISRGFIEKVPPYRYYETSTIFRSGVAVARGMTLKADAPNSSLRVLCSEGDCITPDEVKSLFSEHFQIADDALTQLVCETLNTMRVTEHAQKIFKRDDDDPVDIFARSLSALLLAFPVMYDEMTLSIARAAGRASAENDRRRKLRRALSRLGPALADVDQHLIKAVAPTNHSAFWHGDARYLGFLLEDAANRHGKALGLTKPTARGVRFIHAALDRAGVYHGATPDGECEAIASEMKRWRAESRTPNLTESTRSIS